MTKESTEDAMRLEEVKSRLAAITAIDHDESVAAAIVRTEIGKVLLSDISFLISQAEKLAKVEAVIDSIPYTFIIEDPHPPENKYASYRAGQAFAFSHAQKVLREVFNKIRGET